MEQEIIQLIQSNYSDGYIQSVMYEKYKHTFNNKHISNVIKKLRLKNDK